MRTTFGCGSTSSRNASELGARKIKGDYVVQVVPHIGSYIEIAEHRYNILRFVFKTNFETQLELEVFGGAEIISFRSEKTTHIGVMKIRYAQAGWSLLLLRILPPSKIKKSGCENLVVGHGFAM